MRVCRLKINWGILDAARMHKHSYEAYKDMIKVYIMLLQLYFRGYKIRKRKMLQRIEHLWKHNISAEAILDDVSACTYDGVQYGIRHSKPGLPTNGHQWQHWKRGKEKPAHKSYKVKLERVCSARLIRPDPKATKLDMQRLQM
jgi:hypothetical protein